MAKLLNEKCLVIGEGGAGAEIIKTLHNLNSSLNTACVVASNSEMNKIKEIEDKLDGLVRLDIDGTGKDTKKGYRQARSKREELEELLNGYEHIIHIFGFGGGTGAGTALTISQLNQEYNHIFAGPMPSFDEGRKILKNTIKNIGLLHKYGRFWPFDNNLNKSSLSYESINQRIAREIDYVVELPNMSNWVKRDMDTGNIEDLLIPEQYVKKGAFMLKRFKVNELEKGVSLENLMNRDDSVSYNIDNEIFERAGYIIKLSKEQKLNKETEQSIDRFREQLIDKLASPTIHEGIYKSESDYNELIILFSGPKFTEEEIKEYQNKLDNLEEQFNDTFINVDMSFNANINEELDFNDNKEETEEDLFAENNNNNEPNKEKEDEEFLL